jgi:ABC-2 type transport system ATP-binding protein
VRYDGAPPVISVSDAGVEFSRGPRHRPLRDWVAPAAGRRPLQEKFWALRDVAFEVEEGEAIGVVGRNGHGKSTLLKLIAGVMLPDCGSVEVRRPVAPLIEITGGFVGDLDVRDNIRLAAGLHGMRPTEINERFEEIVEFAEIDEFLDVPYKHLSSGMKVRVAFAVVSRLEAPIILVDEALAVGDKAFRRKCYARIEELLSAGRTLFLVSHSEGDLRRFCHRGLYLQHGRLLEDGPIPHVLRTYRQHAEA